MSLLLLSDGRALAATWLAVLVLFALWFVGSIVYYWFTKK